MFLFLTLFGFLLALCLTIRHFEDRISDGLLWLLDQVAFALSVTVNAIVWACRELQRLVIGHE